MVTGDASPSYLWDFDGWRKNPINDGLDEPRFTIADDIHQINPDAKLIIMLRDPADRYFIKY